MKNAKQGAKGKAGAAKKAEAKPDKGARTRVSVPAVAAPSYDAKKAKVWFDTLTRARAAIPVDALKSTSLRLEDVAISGLGAVARCGQSDLATRLAALPKTEFQPGELTALESACWALWYARQQAGKAKATESNAKVPVDLVKQADEVRERMRSCAEYHLSDDPHVGPRLVMLRHGTGYRDLASDLVGYAEIYAENNAALAGDTKHYRDTDEALADALAGQILHELGDSSQAITTLANIELARAFTLALGAYEAFAPTGRWLLRADPGAASRVFPSWYAVGRPNSGNHKKTKPSQAGTASKPAAS